MTPVFLNYLEGNMPKKKTHMRLPEVAKKLGLTDRSIYNHINGNMGIGKFFRKDEKLGLVVSVEDFNKYKKALEVVK